MSSITTTEKGKVNLNSIESQMGFAQKLLETRVISDTFKNPQQVVIAIQFCISLNIDPMTGLKMMYVVHGKPALFGDGPLSLIQSAGKLEWIKEFWIDDEGNEICFKNKNLKAVPYAAICQLKRIGDENIQEDYFTLGDMQLAQIKSPTWLKYQRTMMRYRARTQALKSKFADVLNGMDIAEYVSQDLPKENIIVEQPVEVIASETTKEKIEKLILETNSDEKEVFDYLKVENLDNLSEEIAKKAINALNQKLTQINSKREVDNV